MNLSEEEFSKEKNHLDETTKLLRDTISNLAQTLYDNEEKQLEFKKYIWDTRSELDPTEMKSIVSIAMVIVCSLINILQNLFNNL